MLGGSGSTGKIQGTLSNGSRTITPSAVSQHRIKYSGENSITYLYHIKSFIFYMNNTSMNLLVSFLLAVFKWSSASQSF